MESATVRHGARIHAYCLMTNHYHLPVETPEGNLSAILQHINGAYTNYSNAKRQRSGHLLAGEVQRDPGGTRRVCAGNLPVHPSQSCAGEGLQ